MRFDHQELRGLYGKLGDTAAALPDIPEYFVEMTRMFEAGELWRDYADLLRMAPPISGGVVMDVGCKFGHALPLFHVLGARQSIGVDVDDEYLRVGNAALAAINLPASLVKSDDGYLPLEPESVDFVLVNEVISHVNPTYLDTLYSEIARVLKVGGHILIADGNNRANADCVADLRNLYRSWEQGPEGADTGRDIVKEPFRIRRLKLAARQHPELSAPELDYLAENTSGLFGDRLAIEVEKHLRKDGWVARPYRPGICPTNPGPGGVVMERAFHPIQVELTLAEFGIVARQVYPRARASTSPIGRFKARLYNLRLAVRELLAPSTLRGRDAGFYILGTKAAIAPVEWHR